MGPLMQLYIGLLEESNKRNEIVKRLSQALFEAPSLLDEDVQGIKKPTGWMYDSLITQLIELKRPKEALSWAKLRYMLCDFDEDSVNRAVASLARAWRAPGSAGEAEFSAFLQAQEDATRPNPLKGVPLPRVDNRQLALLSRSSLAREAAFNVQIVTGAFDKAMQTAHGSMTKQGAVTGGIKGIARVFKAADLNLVSANAFVTAFSAGEGGDLVQAFLAERSASVAPKNARPEPEDASLKSFLELQANLKELERTQPAEAILRYRRFNDEQTNLSPAAGVLVAATIARLHQSLNEIDTALAIYEWALQRYGQHPASLRLILDRARILGAKEAPVAPVRVGAPGAV
jgi:hypothetical protein